MTGLARAGRQVLRGKVAEMRRVVLTLMAALLALTAGAASASAAPPINVDSEPGERGVTVTVSVRVGEEEVPIQSITAGREGGEADKNAGLCAVGVIHTSCTPADEASNRN
jgi:hypothetical protein